MAKRQRPAKRPGQAKRARAEPRRQRGTRAFEQGAVERARRGGWPRARPRRVVKTHEVGVLAPGAPPARRRPRKSGAPDRVIYTWTDRFERAYATLRDDAGHWRIEWGARTPPGSDVYTPRGQRMTSDRDEAVRVMIDRIHRLADDPVAATRAEGVLRASLRRRTA